MNRELSTDGVGGLRMIEEIARVASEITGTDLIAMILESELIKKHQPKYNRRLKKSKFPFGIFDELNGDGYMELSIKSVSKTEVFPLLHFTTKKEGLEYLRNISQKHELCQKLCGLYESRNACFQYEVKECKGACIGIEKKEEYNSRIESYIENLQYNGKSFMIMEKGRKRNEKSFVLIKEGLFLGYGYAPYQFYTQDMIQLEQYLIFMKEDRDIKSIVNTYLRKNKKHRVIEFTGQL